MVRSEPRSPGAASTSAPRERHSLSKGWRGRVLPSVLVTIAAAVVVVLRAPDRFTNAQFYAEDGRFWFADAYTRGAWASLLRSHAGYFQLVSRFAPIIAAPFGPGPEPLIFNLFGLVIQIGPAVFFVTRRFERLVPSVWSRIAIGAIYILMPSTELNVTITNAQFHLVILAVLIIVAPPASSRWWWPAEAAIVVLSALSGPFAFVLLPVAALWLWRRRARFTTVLTGLLIVASALQAYAFTLSTRPSYPLGATAGGLIRIVANRIFLAGIFAEEGGKHVNLDGLPHATTLAAMVCAAGLVVVAYAAFKAPWELRVFGFAAVLIVGSGLAFPLVSPQNQWYLIAVSRGGERYFLMAQVAWVVTLVWAATRLPWRHLMTALLGLTAVCMLSGLVTEWSYPPFINFNWPAEARMIETAPPGTHLTLQEPPSGAWTIMITVR